MTLPLGAQRLMSMVSVGMLVSLFRMILGWFDRHTGPPVMRERINSASDAFFDHEERNWGKAEIDSGIHGKYGEG